MRNIVLLLIALLGLYSFSGSKEERDAFIKKSIEERAKSVGMEAYDMRMSKVEPISERDYERYVQRGVMEGIAGKGTYCFAGKANDDDNKKWERTFEDKLSKLSDKKDYGYFVRVKCRFKNHPMNDNALWTTHFVVSTKATTEVASKS